MELRWYWRVLRRQTRVIWTATAIVAVLAALFTAYTAYGTLYKTSTTIEFFQKPPDVGGTSANLDTSSLALGAANAATNDAKLYTTQHAFFEGISVLLKSRYGTVMDYKAIQAGLGANIIGNRQLELEYKSSSTQLPEHILWAAREQIRSRWLPIYDQDVVQPGAHGKNITVFPVQMRVFDEISSRKQSTSTIVLGWLLKALVGIVLGVALAFLWEYLDESIQDEQDVRNWMAGAPTLGVIPGGKSRVA